MKLDKTVSRGPELKQPLSDACAMSYDVILLSIGIEVVLKMLFEELRF